MMEYGRHGPGGTGATLELERLAEAAGPEAEAALARLRREGKASRCGPVETLRRFRAACTDGSFSTKARTRPRKPRRGQPKAEGDEALARERRQLERLRMELAIVGLEEQFAATDRALAQA